MLKEFLEKRYPSPHQALDIVQEAVQSTIRTQIENEGKIDPARLERAAILGTRGNCLSACAFTLWTLAKNHAAEKHFDRYILLSAWEQDTPRDRQILDHAYFLIRDIQGVWYAGSPANYTISQNPEALTVYTGDIPSITKQLRIYPYPSPCRWPEGGEIEKASRYAEDSMPQGVRTTSQTGYMTVFEIRSIHSITAGLRIERGAQFVTYDFTKRPPSWSSVE